jgi:hypothetical protein
MKFATVSEKQIRDTGLVFTLALMVIAYWSHNSVWLIAGMALLLITMLVPVILKPVAIVWFAFAGILSKVTSTLLLGIVFVVLVTPVGFLRRMTGADPLMRRQWKNGAPSVFRIREHVWARQDLDKPY